MNIKDLLGFGLRSRVYNGVRKIHPQFGYRKTDIYISSFPKSGRNWVSFLLANFNKLYYNKKGVINFKNIYRWVPNDIPVPKKPPIEDEGLPRMVARHSLYEGQDVKSIYIMRHPADVMVSYYHFMIGRKGMELGSFSSMIRDSDLGIPAWVDHVESWEGNWSLVIRYEDLKRDPLNELSRMVDLIGGYDGDIQGIMEKTVKKSSFENMKRVEEKWGLPNKKGKNNNYTFMRSGKSNKGKEKFSDSDYLYLKKRAGVLIDRYGYDLEG